MSAAVVVEGVSKRFTLGTKSATTVKDRLLGGGSDRHKEFWALEDVSLTIEKGETFGLLGHNGSGKSTLLKCIARTLTPTTGSIQTVGSVAALLELGAGFHPELTGRENIELNAAILGISPEQVRSKMSDILAFAEVAEFADTPIKNFSSGMFARLGFAVAMFLEPDILLVDEVLAVGDEAFQQKCLGEVRRLQREGRTIIVVTHSADLVREHCDRAAVLESGRLLDVGEPAEAIRTMRDSYLARALAVPDDLAGPQALHQGEAAKFIDVEVRFPQPDRHWLEPNEALEIIATIELEEPTDDVVLSVALYDNEGRRLLGVNSDRPGHRPGLRSGRVVSRFTLERLPLLGGTYHLDVGLHDHDCRISFDHREKVASFTVQNTMAMAGVVYSPVDVAWESLDEAQAEGSDEEHRRQEPSRSSQ